MNVWNVGAEWKKKNKGGFDSTFQVVVQKL
jgi:hypothetical protein